MEELDSSLTLKEKFEIGREIIRHEDGLVNNRTTWLLVIQGFLFSAFTSGIKLYDDCHSNGAQLNSDTYITIGLFLIGFLGIFSSLVALNIIHEAYRRITEVDLWWKDIEKKANLQPKKDFPSLIYGYYHPIFNGTNLGNVLFFVWIGLLLCLGIRTIH